MRDKLISKRNIFNILIIADVICVFAAISKIVQQTDHLPWDYTNIINNLEEYLQTIKYDLTNLSKYIDSESFKEHIDALPGVFFSVNKTFHFNVLKSNVLFKFRWYS